MQATKENRSIPIVIMPYLNPILAYGIERFAADCVHAGVEGVIVCIKIVQLLHEGKFDEVRSLVAGSVFVEVKS